MRERGGGREGEEGRKREGEGERKKILIIKEVVTLQINGNVW